MLHTPTLSQFSLSIQHFCHGQLGCPTEGVHLTLPPHIFSVPVKSRSMLQNSSLSLYHNFYGLFTAYLLYEEVMSGYMHNSLQNLIDSSASGIICSSPIFPSNSSYKASYKAVRKSSILSVLFFSRLVTFQL